MHADLVVRRSPDPGDVPIEDGSDDRRATDPLLIIALDAVIIWALATYRREAA